MADPDKAWANLLNDPTIHQEENFFRIKHVANALIDKYGAAEADDLLSSNREPSIEFQTKERAFCPRSLSEEPETAFNFAIDTPNDLFGVDACNGN